MSPQGQRAAVPGDSTAARTRLVADLALVEALAACVRMTVEAGGDPWRALREALALAEATDQVLRCVQPEALSRAQLEGVIATLTTHHHPMVAGAALAAVAEARRG